MTFFGEIGVGQTRKRAKRSLANARFGGRAPHLNVSQSVSQSVSMSLRSVGTEKAKTVVVVASFGGKVNVADAEDIV